MRGISIIGPYKTKTLSRRNQEMKSLMKSKNGMCLIEMVLVVAIICILASVLLYNFVGILKVLGIPLIAG